MIPINEFLDIAGISPITAPGCELLSFHVNEKITVSGILSNGAHYSTETKSVRSQNATLERWQYRKYPRCAFTEHGPLPHTIPHMWDEMREKRRPVDCVSREWIGGCQ